MYVPQTFPVFSVVLRQMRQCSILMTKCSHAFICTVDQQTNSSLLSKPPILSENAEMDKQTSTSALGHDWMFHAVVQVTRCLRWEQATWSCVFTMRYTSVGMLLKRMKWVYRMLKKKEKKKPFSSFWWSFFLFSNLYINCNVRSCQYSTFVS